MFVPAALVLPISSVSPHPKPSGFFAQLRWIFTPRSGRASKPFMAALALGVLSLAAFVLLDPGFPFVPISAVGVTAAFLMAFRARLAGKVTLWSILPSVLVFMTISAVGAGLGDQINAPVGEYVFRSGTPILQSSIYIEVANWGDTVGLTLCNDPTKLVSVVPASDVSLVILNPFAQPISGPSTLDVIRGAQPIVGFQAC